MARLLRLNDRDVDDSHRLAVGMLVSSRCTRLSAALVSATGRGLDARLEVLGSVDTALPTEAAALYAPLSAATPVPATSMAALRSVLATAEGELLGDLLAETGVAANRILIAGVEDPGFWKFDRHRPTACLGLCDAAHLAESTGLNVIDAFAARDLVQGGQGGPLTAVAQWVLLASAARGRVLLDLGRTLRMSYLPVRSVDQAIGRVLAFDVGPGMALLDELASRLTGGQHRLDPGGRLAVQGRRIGELIDHWLADSYFERPLPRWHPHGVRPERFLAEAMQMAVERGWSVRDLLCSATHFVAESVKVALQKRIPEDAQIDEIVVTGGGQHNGLLLGEIGRHVAGPLVRLDDLHVEPDSLEPACIATLALLYLDQIPANPTAVTGAEAPRILGRITPGSVQSWNRLLQSTGASPSSTRPLRNAS